MKILHAGNMANLGYVIVRQLRKDGIDAELLMEKNPPKGSDPTRFDPSLKGTYPKWIFLYDKKKPTWKIDVVNIMRDKKYDLIHAYVELPIFAPFSGKPFIANTQGSDFREMAFSKSIRGVLLRRAYRKAKVVLFFQPDHYPLFSKLKLENGVFLPPLWDTSFFKSEVISDGEFSGKFVIFHPANLEWRLKGNDILIKGFAKFVEDNQNSVLIIVDRGIDSQKTHQLVNSLDIESKIHFIKGPLEAERLLHYYNLADVVADQFILGALGSIGWEVFSCAKPLLAFVNEEQYTNLYGEPPPIFNASSSEDICNQLEILKDEKIKKEIGKKAHTWITKYHSPIVFSTKIQKIYESVLNGEKIDKIRTNISKITIS